MLSRLNKQNKGGLFADDAAPLEHGLGFTIRLAYPDDQVPLRRLAALDSQRPLAGRALVAEVAGELWAAIGIEGDRRVIADPFRRTATLIAVLELQAAARVPAPRAHIPVRGAGRPAAAAAH
jgi:hypothetical protein